MIMDSTLNEIREKIFKLRTAIMYSMCDEVCKLPNSIVTALQVDDEGQLWFICQKPLQDVVELEGSFPVRLHFYRKGIFFHLEVSGKATIAEDDYAGYIPAESPAKGRLMLIKMSMNSVEYTEPYGKKERSRLEALVEKGYKWMSRNLIFPHTSKQELSENAV
jgi:hypothetical protein